MRRFDAKQRTALYLASGGKCSICGEPLGSAWHADHVRPWSAGGETDVLNGQALCPKCNREKGAIMPSPWPIGMPLRNWQERAFRQYLRHEGDDFFVVATPGAGKTEFALWVASELFKIGRIVRVVGVCPTEHLKNQWAEKAHAVGISIDPEWANRGNAPARDYDGVVVTYAQVAVNPDWHRSFCREPTLVILDEIHHAGDGNSWGDAMRRAFGPAYRRLSLSGTPFRSDNSTIPFVTYIDGESRADFTYSYGEALADEVCRPILFPSYESHAKWYSNGESHEATFRDELAQRLAAQRLKTAISAGGGWLRKVIGDADSKLTALREFQPDAAGLIVAMDKTHAGLIGAMVAARTGTAPVVVTYDDPDASAAIKAFAESNRRWIVAVRMVSEGVDIKRLRVGVYATNITTEMFFRQVVGRFVRMQVGYEDQNAYLFMPRDPNLFEFAQKIKEERKHWIEEMCREERERDEAHRDDKVASPFVPISATGHPDDVIFDHSVLTQDEIREAEAFRRESGAPSTYDPAILARMIRMIRDGVHAKVAEPEAGPAVSEAEAVADPVHVQKKHKRKIVKVLVNTLIGMSDNSLNHEDIYTEIYRRNGCKIGEATMQQLQDSINYLERWIKVYPDGR
jgi:superfamily II DNA or RNA helicase